ncbi:MAG: hypothetical protein ACREBB_02375 [Nitrosotalea sp.]
MSDDLLKDVKSLLASGMGDEKRLRDILDCIKQKNPVYMSDYKYIQNLVSEASREGKTETTDVKTEARLKDPLALLRIRLAEGKITIDEFRDLKKTISEL